MKNIYIFDEIYHKNMTYYILLIHCILFSAYIVKLISFHFWNIVIFKT